MNIHPKSLRNEHFLIHGQGVFLFHTEKECAFNIETKDGSDGLKISLNTKGFFVECILNGDKYISQMQDSSGGGLSTNSGAYYWFSLDSQNQCLQAGLGEPRIECRRYAYQFDRTDKLWEANKIFLESLVAIRTVGEDSITPLKVLKDPIPSNIPLRVKGIDELTMDDVASNAYLPYASLSTVAQSLYNCVAGKNFTLDTPDFPDFSKAIEHSIQTPGLWCNTRLKQKATEFGKDPQPLETYLRITLGQNTGESPGIPYVMEIWPVGHYSPIHNHGNAHAIIRVLHGNIHVRLFPYLCDDSKQSVEPFGTADFQKDELTWISPTFNQVHQLKNLEDSTDTCITIQCYTYDNDDKIHYDYFDYLGDKNAKNQYEPDSDMDFVEFKKTMKKEWNEYKSSLAKSQPQPQLQLQPQQASNYMSVFSSLWGKLKN